MSIRQMLIAIFVLCASGCDKSADVPTAVDTRDGADTVYSNGKIYTVNASQPWAEALAVTGNEIVYVGTNADAQAFVGEDTELVDLAGRMMMPGFVDTHAHTRIGGQMNSVMLNLFDVSNDKEAALEKIRDHATTLGPDQWVLGTGLSGRMLHGQVDRHELDEAAGGRPAFISSGGQHSGWYNTKALQYFGVSKDTPDPESGRIDREEDGVTPSGTMHEMAHFDKGFIGAPQLFTPADQELAVATGVAVHNSRGITSFIDAACGSAKGAEDVYRRMIEKGTLNARAACNLIFLTPRSNEENFESILARRDEGNDMFSAVSVKMQIDGTPHMLEPYSDGSNGPALLTQERLNDVIEYLTENDMRVYIHVMGDGGVDLALNAFKHANDSGKPLGDGRNALTHIDLMGFDNVPRMAELGIVAQIQAHWAAGSEWQSRSIDRLGEKRHAQAHPFAELRDAGVTLAAGADWPVGPEDTPFDQIQIGVTRQDLEGKYAPTPGRSLRVEEMIEAFTINGAWLMFREDLFGSLEVGKRADMIVVDQNILEVPASDIHKTKALLTVVDGRTVYEHESW